MYSCKTAPETLEWIKAITHFLKPYKFFSDFSVVNFIKDRLWEKLDQDWIDCLKTSPVEHLLLIPSGVVQDDWPESLKEYVRTAKSLAFPREQVDLEKMFPGLSVTVLNPVVSQGMNPKKKHEIEVLSSLVSSITRSVGAHTVVDVGAGQGYLTQVLSFEHQLPVVAIDASSHHGIVTSARAQRIKKHYLSKLRNSGKWESQKLIVPKTITSRILSSSMLRDLSNSICKEDAFTEYDLNRKYADNTSCPRCDNGDKSFPSNDVCADRVSSIVLAGLHACGDLSVTMLRAFSECEEVKAVISIGCCYNFLTEDGCENGGFDHGFPVSDGVKLLGISLGKSARDLACQSAERWRSLENEAAVQNFDMHACRAGFQMLLDRYYPYVLLSSPSIGRQGKALIRKQKKEVPVSSDFFTISRTLDTNPLNDGSGSSFADDEKRLTYKYDLFKKYCHSGLERLGLNPLHDMDLPGLWSECQPFAGLTGLYWSLRAAIGPLLETLILLDRLLFLQEQEKCLHAELLPIFNPALSPRNLAIIARKR